MTKLKFKKKDDYIPRKPVSEKKISNVIHLEGSESTEKIKIGFKSTGVKDKNYKE